MWHLSIKWHQHLNDNTWPPVPEISNRARWWRRGEKHWPSKYVCLVSSVREINWENRKPILAAIKETQQHVIIGHNDWYTENELHLETLRIRIRPPFMITVWITSFVNCKLDTTVHTCPLFTLVLNKILFKINLR